MFILKSILPFLLALSIDGQQQQAAQNPFLRERKLPGNSKGVCTKTDDGLMTKVNEALKKGKKGKGKKPKEIFTQEDVSELLPISDMVREKILVITGWEKAMEISDSLADEDILFQLFVTDDDDDDDANERALVTANSVGYGGRDLEGLEDYGLTPSCIQAHMNVILSTILMFLAFVGCGSNAANQAAGLLLTMTMKRMGKSVVKTIVQAAAEGQIFNMVGLLISNMFDTLDSSEIMDSITAALTWWDILMVGIELLATIVACFFAGFAAIILKMGYIIAGVADFGMKVSLIDENCPNPGSI